MQGKYIKSKRADQDIRKIVLQSIKDFGEEQTDQYMTGLEGALISLACNQDMGKAFLHGRTGNEYRRFRYMSHVVYYRKRVEDIFILRILHTRMLPENHL